MTEICRPFASGSRTAPDPQDSYLESKGFYRKHTARDGSSLFRVVSEQVFDIQLYHEMVREDCIGYIERHRRDFERDMDKNYFYYLSILRKPRTSGTLLELRALAHCYKRNVLLFQQFNVGVWFVNESNYAEKEPLRVFISQDRHFDSVFTKDFVELAAKCQALVYELLYINVFRLPDVEYAVERMLYDQDEQKTKPLLDDETKYQTMTGKVCKFDDHTTTDCVLDNDKLCHFHNRENFQELVDTYTTSQAIYNKKLSTKREKQLDSFLYESDKSCVRQLLMENITPFPYKVAKALDWSIYRNIEFDLWSEDRKEMRLKWIEANNADYQKQGFVEGCSDYQSMKIFGTKANHYHKRYFKGSLLDEKSGSCVSGQGFVSREQYDEMSDEQKKKYVLLNDHSDICKVGTGLTGLHNFQPCLQEMIVMPAGLNHNQNGQRGGFGHKQRRGRGGQINNHQNHQIAYSNVPAHNMNNQSEEKQECIEYNHNNSNEVQYMPYYTAAHPGSYYEQQPYMAVQYDSAVPMPPIPAQYQVAPQAAWSQGYYNGQPATLPTSNSMPQPLMPQYAVYPPTGGYTYFTHDQRFRTDPQFQPVSYTTLQPYSSISAGQVMPVAGSNVFPDSLNLINSKDLVANINYSVKESIDTNGKDLNVNDLQTLQFFFNLGLKYFRCHQQVNHLEQPQIEINQENHAQQPQQQHQQMQLVPVSEQRPTSKGNNDPDNRAIGNTPTTTKGFAFGHGGNSNRHNGPGNTNGNSNYRKPFTNNRVYQNKRNDVKFNPNVKNVHKNNNNNHLTTNGQINGSAPQSSTVPMHSPILPATENPIVGDNNIAQNQMYPVYTTQFLQCYSNDPNEAAGGVMHQQFVIPYAPPPINQPIMTQTDPGSADPMQYSNNFTSYIYAPAFVPPTTPISTAGVQQPNYLYYSPMHTLPSPTPQPVVSVSSTNTSSTNTFNSSGSM